MRRGTSPGVALQGIELDGLSGRVALCRSVSATVGSRNGSLRPTAEARSRSAATAGNPAERSRVRPLADRGPADGVCGDSCAIMHGLAVRVRGCPRIWPAWVWQSTISGTRPRGGTSPRRWPADRDIRWRPGPARPHASGPVGEELVRCARHRRRPGQAPKDGSSSAAVWRSIALVRPRIPKRS
jgi:hypothetical protein